MGTTQSDRLPHVKTKLTEERGVSGQAEQLLRRIIMTKSPQQEQSQSVTQGPIRCPPTLVCTLRLIFATELIAPLHFQWKNNYYAGWVVVSHVTRDILSYF